jgi:hypothetical protein
MGCVTAGGGHGRQRTRRYHGTAERPVRAPQQGTLGARGHVDVCAGVGLPSLCAKKYVCAQPSVCLCVYARVFPDTRTSVCMCVRRRGGGGAAILGSRWHWSPPRWPSAHVHCRRACLLRSPRRTSTKPRPWLASSPPQSRRHAIPPAPTNLSAHTHTHTHTHTQTDTYAQTQPCTQTHKLGHIYAHTDTEACT